MPEHKIPKGWEETTLGDVAEYINRGVAPAYSDSGVAVLNQKCIRDGHISDNESRYTNPDIKNIPVEKYLKPSDILICSTGTGTLGRVGQVLSVKTPTTVDSHISIVRIANGFDKKFFGFLLRGSERKIELMAEGSTGQMELPRSKLANFNISLPSLIEQRAIAAALSSLDDKIELLREQNKTLEAIAQALFKRWFVDFEFPDAKDLPYKSSGGKMAPSSLGPIPVGWKADVVGKIVSQITDRVRKSENSMVLSAVNTGNLVRSDEYFTKQVYSENISKYIKCEPGDFAYNPARINIGSIGRNNFQASGAVSPVYVVFRPQSISGRWLEFVIKTEAFRQHVDKFANGSVRQSLNYDGFERFELVIPEETIVLKFDATITELDKKNDANTCQIQTLSALRDTLLPKLMKGELRVTKRGRS